MACRPRVTVSGTSTRQPSSSVACATTSKAHSAPFEKPNSQSASPFASKAVDESPAGHALGAPWLCGGGRSRDWLVRVLDYLLVQLRPGQPARSGLLQFLWRGQAIRHEWRLGRLRPGDAAPGRAADHRPGSISFHPAAVLPPALLHAADRTAGVLGLSPCLLRDGGGQRRAGRGADRNFGEDQPTGAWPGLVGCFGDDRGLLSPFRDGAAGAVRSSRPRAAGRRLRILGP